MAGLTNMKQKSTKIYDLLTKNSEKKVMMLNNKLGVDKFVFLSKNKWQITYYDTPDNLLTKTGILLYRTYENGKYFFKIEKLSFLPSVYRLRKNEYFEVNIAPDDTPRTQAFYLINGITEMFSTQFYIDLENVLKTAVPKMEIDIKGRCYKGFRGDGFKFLVEFQKVTYKNFVTKRKNKTLECTVTQNVGQSFDNEFAEFVAKLERYCKEIIPQKDTRYDIGMHLTQTVIEAPKNKKEKKQEKEDKKKAEKEKKLKVEDKIED